MPRPDTHHQDFRKLRDGLHGTALVQGDAGYDAARQIWNGTIDKRPLVIVRCAGVSDVVDAVRFARKRRLGVSVRGGGHHVAGSSLIDGGLVVDLSQMRGVRAVPWSSSVRCEGGAQIGDLDRETQPFGLAVPQGLVSETGVAGLTLAGGLGWMRRKYGLSCDNLISADVVLADGRLVRAARDVHPELFWALRGGGWDLGVVVSLEFAAHALGPDVFMSFVTYPRSEGREVLRRFRDVMATAPLGMAPVAVCWSFPADEAFPRELWGQPFVGVIGPYVGPLDEGERAMQPLRKLGRALTDKSGPQRWVKAQRFFDEDYPNGARYYWKSTYLNALDDACIDALLAIADARPSPLSSIDIWPLGGAIGDVGTHRSPLAQRSAPYMIGVESNWHESAGDSANVAFCRTAIRQLEPFSTGGSYMNFDDPDDVKATAAAFGGSFERLRRVKQQYDPDNLFRSRRGLDRPLVPSNRPTASSA